MFSDFSTLSSDIRRLRPVLRFGRIIGIGADSLLVEGLHHHARLGDQVTILGHRHDALTGEVLALSKTGTRVMTYGPCEGVALGDLARLDPAGGVSPCVSWIGRVVDAMGQALDGYPLEAGQVQVALRAAPPRAAIRKPLGQRVHTSVAALDTMLPLARGQRLGLFAGSGVGKSSLLAQLARQVEADVVVLALIGERGRELKYFTDEVLGAAGMARSVVVAATSDQSPLLKRRAAWTAMSIAEYFRDSGKHVLLLLDSVTRFAEAHREVALTAGEAPSLRAFPPSTSNMIANLAERAGPGQDGHGDITAVFSVLVAGSDMEEPIADITRGILDGHIILDREIAERGRFPAIDVRRSVSRSLPGVASSDENTLINKARAILGSYENALPMIQTGLYVPGSSAAIDEAVSLWPELDRFFSLVDCGAITDSYDTLAKIMSQD